MIETNKYLEFEKKLVNELANLGIHTEFNFKVPGSGLILDLYIKTPIRGLIEIKAGSFDLSTIDKRIDEFQEIHSKFNKSIWMFVVFFGSDKKIETLINRYKQLPFQFIHVPNNIEDQHIYCAKQIRRNIVLIALGLKHNEINIRRKEKKEIINSIENANRHLKLLTIENEKYLNESEYLYNKLDQLKESGKDIKKIAIVTEELSRLRHTSSWNQKTIVSLEHQLINSEKSLIKIESEIPSLEYQIQVLEEENDINLKSNSSVKLRKTRSKNKIAQLSEEQAKKLESTVFTSDSSFNQEGMFKDVLPSFKAFLDPEKYALLEKEVIDFEEEYHSKHYTTAALRIGRTLEFVVYTLVKSWGVDTSVPSTSRINKLESSYNSLRKKLITFYSDKDFLHEDEREKEENSLYKAISHVQNHLIKIAGKLDKDEVFSTERPVNIHALLKSVRKEKIRQRESLEAIDDLINSKLIEKTYEARNLAAHANHTGLKIDFNEDQVKLMANDLKEILFKLSNINSAIIQSTEEE